MYSRWHLQPFLGNIKPGTLTVNTVQAITTQPVSDTKCSSSTNEMFTVGASGPNLSYQWLINNSPITNSTLYSGATSTNLTISSVAGLNGKQYSCVVANGCPNVIFECSDTDS